MKLQKVGSVENLPRKGFNSELELNKVSTYTLGLSRLLKISSITNFIPLTIEVFYRAKK